MLGRISIRILLPLLMGLPVAVAALVLVSLWSGNARQSAAALNASEMAQIHARINERLGTLLGMPGRAAALQREAILSGRLDPNDLRSWHDPLFDLTRAMDMISGVSWGNTKGEAVWVFRYPGKPHPELGISDARTTVDGALAIEEYALDTTGAVIERIGGYPFDARNRPWYTGAVAAGGPTFLAPYAWVNGDGRAITLGLPFVEPVFQRDGSEDSGELLGVLAAEFSLQDLSDFLRTLRVGTAGFVLILDAHGRLVAHSLPAGDVPAAVEIDGVPTVPVAATMDDPRVRELAGVAAGANGGAVVPVAGEPMLVRVSAFNSLPGLDWRIITALPEAELLAPVAAARASSHRATLVAVLATILLGLGAGLVATMPVRRLVREIRRVGQGELDERVRPEPSSELRQIAEAVNAMAEDLRDRVRVRESLLVAMEVQKNLLPQEAPIVAGLDVAGHSTYCDETGGDYYDYLDVQPLDGGATDGRSRVALAIGDVMGHGVAAAMLMATARGILRSRCDEPASLGELLTHLNDLLVGDTGGKRFMTMLLVMLDGGTGAMAWASAGHDPPMVYLAKDDRFAGFDGGGIPLGLFAGQAYETDTGGPLAPGDVVVLSTDGLWEARTTEGEFYGKQRLEAVIREHAGKTAEQIAAAIRADHIVACGESSQDDDITFVVAKMLARAAGG